MKRRKAVFAFSLVEVTLALGIAAFALLAIFGQLPVGLRTSRDSIAQTGAANVIAAVAEDLRAAPSTATTSSMFAINIPSNTTSTTVTLFLTEQGQYSTSLSPNSRYRVNITFNPNSAGANAATFATVAVTWPAAAALTDAAGSAETFVAIARN